MKQFGPMLRFLPCALLVACLYVGSWGNALAKEPLPEVSPEGLQLQKSKNARIFYLRPGTSFARYGRVAILDADVEFAERWQRDYNANASGIQDRVTTRDVERIKAAIAGEFKRVFTEELQRDGAYEVVQTAGPDVLALRPAIVDVEVTVPDLLAADARKTLARSAGQMTLYLELWDSESRTILARVMDPKEHENTLGLGRLMNRGTNKAALDEMLRDWALKLRKQLDEARGQRPASQ
jgi:hypothetical protein